MASEGLAKLARVVAGEPAEASGGPGLLEVIAEATVADAAEDVAEEVMAETQAVPDEQAEPEAIAEPGAEALAEIEPKTIAELDAFDPGPDAPHGENDEHDAIEIVDELCFDTAIDESDGAPSVPAPAVEDPFARLVHALESVAIAHGAGEESIICMRALFGVTRSDGMAPGERATEALLAAGIIRESAQEGRGLVRSGAFTAQVVAWQGILRGESEDFAACGGAALDEWAAGALARVLGSPSKAEGLRRELRARGVAAFGLLADAA
jgi:hypothetical protein